MKNKYIYYNEKQKNFLYDKQFGEIWGNFTPEQQNYLLSPWKEKQEIFGKNPNLFHGVSGRSHWERTTVKPSDFLRKQEYCIWVAGRGSGKTNTIGKTIALMFMNLPKATCAFASISYTQVETNILPEVWQCLSDYELVEGIHYVYGEPPPKEWEKPYRKVEDYKHAISFLNGFCVVIYSAQAGDKPRGASVDCCIVDEAAFIDKSFITKVLFPTVRANALNEKLRSNPLHWKKFIFTSAGYEQSQQWIWEYESMAKQSPEIYYFESSTPVDNIDVLPPNYIDRLKENMTELEFDVEVMNKKINTVDNPFYPKFSEDKHVHYPSFKVVNGKNIYNDYNPKQSICISIDKNNAICSATIYQDKAHSFDMINNIWVKYQTITDLIELFCDTYKDQENKRIKVYGDRNLYDIEPKTGNSYVALIKTLLIKNGWGVSIEVDASNMEHSIRYFVVNYALSFANIQKPIRMNGYTCEAAIISIRNTASRDDKKDKRSERDSKMPQEYATHLSDTFDYIVTPTYANSAYEKTKAVPD